MKTMAIRLDDDLHAQLQVIAQLEQTTITDIIRTAIENHMEAKRNDPALAAQAEGVLAEIDDAAAKRRDAIGALFQANPKATGTSRRGRKATGGE